MTLGIVKKALGRVQMGKGKPLWLDTVTKLYPPLTFTLPEYVKETRGVKVPKPPRIIFPEDHYRHRFYRERPIERYKVTSMDERLKATETGSDRLFTNQIKLMEEGIPAEKAYQMASRQYLKERRQEELRNDVAQQQVARHTEMAASKVIEQVAMDEKLELEEQLKEEMARIEAQKQAQGQKLVDTGHVI